jgi:hypothetical protein
MEWAVREPPGPPPSNSLIVHEAPVGRLSRRTAYTYNSVALLIRVGSSSEGQDGFKTLGGSTKAELGLRLSYCGPAARIHAVAHSRTGDLWPRPISHSFPRNSMNSSLP